MENNSNIPLIISPRAEFFPKYYFFYYDFFFHFAAIYNVLCIYAYMYVCVINVKRNRQKSLIYTLLCKYILFHWIFSKYGLKRTDFLITDNLRPNLLIKYRINQEGLKNNWNKRKYKKINSNIKNNNNTFHWAEKIS